MLIEFRFKNFLSFRDEQVFSFVASPDKAHPNNLIKHRELNILRSSAVYGANAAGKSNFIKAISFVQTFVQKSANANPGDPIKVAPFKLNSKTAQAPSFFEVSFVVNDVRYRYGFEVSSSKIHGEWLYAYPQGREQKWFERTLDKQGQDFWAFGPHLRGAKQRLADLTRDNSLFISLGAKLNHEQLTSIQLWFSKQLSISGDSANRKIRDELFLKMAERKPSKNLLRSFKDFIQGFDLGFEGIEVRKHRESESAYVHSPNPSLMRKLAGTIMKSEVAPLFKAAAKLRRFFQSQTDVMTLHKGEDSSEFVSFLLKEESKGTQRIIDLAGLWLFAMQTGKTVVMDELETSLHPLLSRKLVELFHDPKWNKGNGQLLFATHETSLMDLKLFRRDQIWFTEKDSAGASHLYSLYDYKNKPRLEEAIQRGYLSGRYGALPVFKEFNKGE